MKFTLNWLKEFLETDASIDEISEKLTDIGLEVEKIIDKSDELKDFKIAQILEAEKHPNADKLKICKVNTGKETLQIVCGAPNARAGINVVLAPIGAIMPEGFKIKKSKIRDIESNGMLCSAAELNLGNDSNGIIEMDANSDDIGKCYTDLIGLEVMFEIAITPNRGDCLGVYGIARDLAAAGIGRLKELKFSKINDEIQSDLQIDSVENCPYISFREFKVENKESPSWLKSRLDAIGITPNSALVDITNYISYSFGRPLHVYDKKKIKNKISVKPSSDSFTALDGKEYKLENDLVISDENILSLAGIIGAENSKVDLDSKEIVLELAIFDAENISSTGRKHDIITDSRYRFERNVDLGFVDQAMAITSQMIIDLCDGKASNITEIGNKNVETKEIEFDYKKLKSLSGCDIDISESKNILSSLGFKFNDNLSKVIIPSHRHDIIGQADIVEEILRIYGYNNIQSQPLKISNTDLTKSLTSKLRRSVAREYNEVISWSFMDSKLLNLFSDQEPIIIDNPISSELDAMRPVIVSNLLLAAKRNLDRSIKNFAFFEIGPIFNDKEENILSAIKVGEIDRNIHSKEIKLDIFHAKSDLYEALQVLSIPVNNLQISRNAPKYYHPARSAEVRLGKNILGYFGEIHPKILKKFGIKTNVVAFEVLLDNIQTRPKKAKRAKYDVSDLQVSKRDFAFLVNDNVSAADIIKSASKSDKKIASIDIFDIYQGERIEEGKKSVAITVDIHPTENTLTDDEIEAISKNIIDNIKKDVNGELRL